MKHHPLTWPLILLLTSAGNVLASVVEQAPIHGHADHQHEIMPVLDAETPLGEFNGDSTTVFETVELFRHTTFFTERFVIDTAGTYQAVLTDFEFPKPLKESALNITTSSDLLGTLLGTGTLSFEADPGTYFISLFARAGGSKPDHGHGRGFERDRPEHPRAHHGHHGGLGQYGVQISLVSAVPVPAALWLFGSGLAALGTVAWRRRLHSASDSASMER